MERARRGGRGGDRGDDGVARGDSPCGEPGLRRSFLSPVRGGGEALVRGPRGPPRTHCRERLRLAPRATAPGARGRAPDGGGRRLAGRASRGCGGATRRSRRGGGSF